MTTVDDHTDDESRMLAEETKLDEDEVCSFASEGVRWLRKERKMKRRIDRVQKRIDKYKAELDKVKGDCNFADMSYIRQQAKQKDTSAVSFWNRIINFRSKKPIWSELKDVLRHCIILSHLATKAYEHARKEGLLKLPGRTTFREFIGGLENLLKTGIAAGPEGSNVLHEQESGPSNALPAVTRTPRDPSELSRGATDVLKRFKMKTVPAILPTLQVTATVDMGGYIARVVREHIDCDYCCQLTSKVPSS
ncbi:hypothetical protein HPB51_020871 [Rhipicephalus microplus]|uniref:Uncharacterized protein n=1 Tax=Rhipicephalus microplus TaxID=6941 RepID=A0A9J6E4G4_RHIMP|nr:hypothetical protein HPB51_020871 [Rhipicephalus microplus]